MIWIRTDANDNIGTGHVMRCMSIAEKLNFMGEEVCFIIADSRSVALVEDKSFPYHILGTDYTDMDSEIPVLEAMAENLNPKACLVDSYFVSKDYLKALGNICRVAYIDDINSFDYPVDMIINYNIYGKNVPYNPCGKTLLLGTEYVPLRTEFQSCEKYCVVESVKTVLLTTGGADKYNIATSVIQELVNSDPDRRYEFHIVCGVYNGNYPFLCEMADRYSNIYVYKNVKNMAELMGKADVAVSAGGSTMYELSAMGVPTICFSFADNQMQLAKTFGEENMALYVGDYRDNPEGFPKGLVNTFENMSKDYNLRSNLSIRQQTLVDGQGANRIAQAIVKMGKDE